MTEVDAAASTDAGKKYKSNFDVVHLESAPLLAIVADGMGSTEGSAVAGRTTVDTVVERVHEADAIGADTLRQAVAVAHERLRTARLTRDLGLTGCTLTALVDGGAAGWWITHIGDSRAYRLRGDLLELLTTDHTNAWTGITHGIYAFDSKDAERGRYQLTRFMGHTGEPEPDVLNVAPRTGDVFLLCTDGIADQVPFLKLREILLLDADARTKVDRIVEAASEAGGGDNASAIVVAVP